MFITFEFIVWLVALSVRVTWLDYKYQSKPAFLAYLFATALISIGILVLAFEPDRSRAKAFGDVVMNWQLVSAAVMFAVPRRLIAIPSGYVIAWYVYAIGSFLSMEMGNESYTPNIETFLYGTFILLASIASLLKLRKWFTSEQSSSETD